MPSVKLGPQRPPSLQGNLSRSLKLRAQLRPALDLATQAGSFLPSFGTSTPALVASSRSYPMPTSLPGASNNPSFSQVPGVAISQFLHGRSSVSIQTDTSQKIDRRESQIDRQTDHCGLSLFFMRVELRLLLKICDDLSSYGSYMIKKEKKRKEKRE